MLTIVLPLPPKECSPNARYSGNWRKKGDAVKAYRSECRMLAHQARFAQGLLGSKVAFDRVTITATFFCARKVAQDGRYRPLDSTNAAASLKAAVDGLVDAFVVERDDHRHVRMMPPVLKRTAKEHQGRAEVVLEIEPWEGC